MIWQNKNHQYNLNIILAVLCAATFFNNMNRLILILVLISFNNLINSQNVIEVDYKIQINSMEDVEKVRKTAGQFMKEVYSLEVDFVDETEFKLLIRNDETLFFLSKDYNSPKNTSYAPTKHKGTAYLAGFSNVIISRLNKRLVYDQNFRVMLIIESPKEWFVSDESKEIDGYRCYKALANYVVVNPAGTFTFPVVAWFTPEIPVSAGPLYFNGLPGLIMQLSYRYVTYEVKRINFNSNQTMDLTMFDKIRLVNAEEYMKMSEEIIGPYTKPTNID